MCPTRDTNTAGKGVVEKGKMRGRQWLNGIMHKCQAIYSALLGVHQSQYLLHSARSAQHIHIRIMIDSANMSS